ncbi:hypothetical protein BD309DRAFT_975657 [Dichomitus squalens]|nr:hypothetical protein BD309DRAFT_975657 [Dichomitus squalens]
MATQPWYTIEDIVYQVFEHLHVDIESAQSDAPHCRQALARLARSCRAFAHPALTVLWRSLPRDRPLTELLCTLEMAEAVDLKDRSASGRVAVLRIQQDIRAHPQWKKFSQYAAYVRKISLYPFRPFARSAIWQDLATLMDGAPALPRLTSVFLIGRFARTHSSAPSSLNLGCLALIHSSVREVRLQLSPWAQDQDALQRLMSRIFTSAPDLESLRSVYSPESLGHPGLLTHFPHVHHVTIDVELHSGDLRNLARLPALRHLSIFLSSLSSERLAFPSVTHLCVRGLWESISDSLESAHIPQLRSLSISTEDAQSLTDTSRLLHIIATAYATLERLSIDIHAYDHIVLLEDVNLPPPEPRPAGRLADVTRPLLSLRALRNLSLRFEGYDLGYTSDDVQAFAEAWTRLEEIRLDFGVAIEPRAGIESLVHIARNCPRLRVLGLPGTDVVEDTLTSVGAATTPHATLCELVIPHVVFRGTDEARLSAEMWEFIARQFPNAARLCARIGTQT